mgnify:FL=1
MRLDRGESTNPCRVERIAKFGFRIVLTQGLNRQIRRMCEAFGYTVQQLRRVRIDNVQLGNLRVGAWRNLTPAELGKLLPRNAPKAQDVRPPRDDRQPRRTRRG